MRRPGVEQLHALLRGAVPGPRGQAAHQHELRAGEQAVQGPWQPTIFETRSPRFRPARSQLQGKIFTLDRYDNYDAIEVPYVDAIPSDYDGVMGVPITFLDRYCPEQFEILGSNRGIDQDADGMYGRSAYVDGVEVFKRIFIRKRG